MKYSFNSVYRITNCFAYNDKDSGEKRRCVSAIKQSKFPVSNLTNFYFSDDEFVETFEDYIDDSEFNKGLVGLYLKTDKLIEENICKISKEKFE